mmetsp:Transcript_16485/g.35552  ORF Transcript_16485/g.35552 Transcript_16485/m.35552 type:complete len:128 (+) Transcript_16485:100-483(+)
MSTTLFSRAAKVIREGSRHWLVASRTGAKGISATQARLASIEAVLPAALAGNERAISLAVAHLHDFDAIVRSSALSTMQDIASSGSDGAVVLAFYGLEVHSKGPRFQTIEYEIARKTLRSRLASESE